MSQKTGIAWTDSTWNPVVGCQKVSEGCRNCYAKDLHDLRHKAHQEGKRMPAQYAQPFNVVQLLEDRLEMPLHWRKPRRIFVNSVSDLWHDAVPFTFITRVFDAMRRAHWHTFQVLTKRAERMFTWSLLMQQPWPENVWLGVSVENQGMAHKRIGYLNQVPAALRFVSCEPLLGPLDLNGSLGQDGVQWVIAGGESGRAARPMHVDWARGLRDQCVRDGVPFFFKQWGEWCPVNQTQVQDKLGKALHRWDDETLSLRVGVDAAGHLLDGVTWRTMPR